MPYSDQPPGATPDNTRVGNFYEDDGVANGYNDGFAVDGSTRYNLNLNHNQLTDVGAYTLSSSYYGTFDQGGNVCQWNETLITSSWRGFRGGSWTMSYLDTRSDTRFVYEPYLAIWYLGFRVASIATIPEPSTALIVALAVLTLAFLRRRLP